MIPSNEAIELIRKFRNSFDPRKPKVPERAMELAQWIVDNYTLVPKNDTTKAVPDEGNQ